MMKVSDRKVTNERRTCCTKTVRSTRFEVDLSDGYEYYYLLGVTPRLLDT